jgi:exodeoxyribonuclease-5
MQLTDEQLRVSDAIVEFATGKINAPYIAVSGYAGTGKTTVMGYSAARLKALNPNIAIAFCAPTAKAAGVLEKKLEDFGALTPLSEVRTIHGHIYRLREKKDGELKWNKKYDLPAYDLFVVDEASMVTTKMFKDLMSYNIPVVFIGDPGQLPPIKDVPFKPLYDTEYKLLTVHRQALNNSIIKAATMVRNGEELGYFIAEDGKFGRFSRNNPSLSGLLKAFAKKIPDGTCIFLTGTNKQRVACNKMLRTVLGYKSDIPEVGEHVMCLKNNYSVQVINGRIYTVTRSDGHVVNDACYSMGLNDEADVIAYSRALHFEKISNIDLLLTNDYVPVHKALANSEQDEVCLFDYGYACSVHKSQGSEWEYVVLYDERNHMNMSTESERNCWLYTGITRAREKLCVIS